MIPPWSACRQVLSSQPVSKPDIGHDHEDDDDEDDDDSDDDDDDVGTE